MYMHIRVQIHLCYLFLKKHICKTEIAKMFAKKNYHLLKNIVISIIQVADSNFSI